MKEYEIQEAILRVCKVSGNDSDFNVVRFYALCDALVKVGVISERGTCTQLLKLALGALEGMLAAERLTNRPPATVMQAEEKLDRIRSAAKQCTEAITAIEAKLKEKNT